MQRYKGLILGNDNCNRCWWIHWINLVARLNREGFKDLVLVDDFGGGKEARLQGLIYSSLVHRDHLMPWLDEHHAWVQYVFHLGARTDTMLHDVAIFDRLNLRYSQDLWQSCTRWGLPLLYASSAATYGLGNMVSKTGFPF